MSEPIRELGMVERLKTCLVRAVDMFNRTDVATLLCSRKDPNGNDVARDSSGWGAASERAIAHRLAVYVERELCCEGLLSDVAVDCEYNRHLDHGKIQRIPAGLVDIVEKAKRTAKPDSDDDSFYVFSIAPDIVVHQRGNDSKNLLIIEVKKATNPEIPEYDCLKLECFTKPSSGYGYKLGAAIMVEDNVAPADRRVLPPKWYSNGVAE